MLTKKGMESKGRERTHKEEMKEKIENMQGFQKTRTLDGKPLGKVHKILRRLNL